MHPGISGKQFRSVRRRGVAAEVWLWHVVVDVVGLFVNERIHESLLGAVA